jgi:hypothetical protein
MIKINETNCYNDSIISLWQKSFGDSREDVLYFLNECKHKSCLCLYSDDELMSMLFLVDCTVNDVQYKYIYAACTDDRARKLGYMSTLLEYSQNNYKCVLLIPADDDLVNYYSKRGFTDKIEIDSILFDEIAEIKDYLFEGCELQEPFALANIGD